MSRVLAALPIAVLLAGVGLVAYSVLVSATSVSLVVIVPVLSGRSAAFLGGVALVALGLLMLPLAFDGPLPSRTLPTPAPAQPGPPRQEPGSSDFGGLVLIGPVPIFFGSWRRVSKRTRWLVALVGLALVTTLAIVFLAVR